MLRSAGKTLFNVTLGSTVLYGSGVALSLQNNAFNELFTDNVPFAEEAVDYAQTFRGNNSREYNVTNFKEKFGGFEKTTSIAKSSGVQSERIEAVKESPKKQEKNVEVVKEVQKVLDVKLPLIDSKSSEPTLQAIIDEFNGLIVKINSKELNQNSINIAKVKEIVAKLDFDLKELTTAASDKFNLRLKELVSVKENELLIKFTKDFQKNLEALEDKHQAQLNNELSKAREVLELQLNNAIKINAIENQKIFANLVAQSIEEERNGKLSKFSELNERLSSLQQLYTKFDDHLHNAELRSTLQYQIAQLRSKLQSDRYQDLTPELLKLQEIANVSQNEVLFSAVESINKDVISQGLLTNQQIITRFQLLAPELRSAALLPPNAGILGHLSAKFFSFLLVPKEGDVKGKDIESLIARVQNNLTLNKLDDAVEEVSNLKGWGRKLADDWVIDSRKRLEVEFLVDLIELESRTLY
ncbi:hypothetical protein WICPIJ_008024 [Wickerhamomyces pijperi]|uniref:MICOS complex subunit MIC60 n=1 Tax=Wickerhamomyces pijperi TaxID=599730 RepID=A0A9P8TJD4_WICPI|nr:hypothetical protein WICPIJ_008024 [Wickerhamomyces pijperi]